MVGVGVVLLFVFGAEYHQSNLVVLALSSVAVSVSVTVTIPRMTETLFQCKKTG